MCHKRHIIVHVTHNSGRGNTVKMKALRFEIPTINPGVINIMYGQDNSFSPNNLYSKDTS